jgi:TRAP-type C4-dicarboxylate transport system substrate-binding protein
MQFFGQILSGLRGSLLAITFGAAIALPVSASAEPIKLKFSFFTSDQSAIYQTEVKPFVDAVNAEGQGLIQIEVYFSGAISKVQSAQPQLVADGDADFASFVPSQTPDLFSDIGVLELPGLFRDAREGSRVFDRLVAARALKGFDDYILIGGFVSAGESIHSRRPLSSLADLNGQTIRVNNAVEATTLEKLGAIPVLLALNQTNEKLSQNKIDGATVPPSMLFEFGFGRVTDHHYMIHLGGAPNGIIMNRAKFDSLPPQAQAIIRKYSGDWLSDRVTAGLADLDERVLAQVKTDPRRTVSYPSAADASTIQSVYSSVVEQWAASSHHNRELLDRVQAEITKLRSNN